MAPDLDLDHDHRPPTWKSIVTSRFNGFALLLNDDLSSIKKH